MRSDGGGMLGSDAALTPQVSRILMGKLPLLNSPGSLIENSLYYDVNSSTISAVEMQETWAKDRIQLTSSQFGGSGTGYIPSVLFANTTFVKFVLPDMHWHHKWLDDDTVPGGADNGSWVFGAANRFYIPSGWGFWAIRDIVLYMGASSIAQISLSGEANMMIAMACCETLSKRTQLWKQAGLMMCPTDSASIMAYPPKNSASTPSVWRTKLGQSDIIAPGAWPFNPAGRETVLALRGIDWMRQACVPLRLPYSSMVALEKRLSMDCKLLTQPIQITINMRAGAEFWDVTAGCLESGVVPDKFESVTYQMWQQELSDKSISVRNELLAMPEFNVGYPFQYAQTYTQQATYQGTEEGTTDDKYLVNLTSIINADLTTFMVMVTWNGNNSPGVGHQFNPLVGLRLYDVELQLNGQRYFSFENDDFPQVTLAKQLDLPFGYTQYRFVPRGVSGYGLTSVTAPRSTVVRNCFYEFNNSKLRSIVGESHMQNTGRFTSQTWQLAFRIDKDTYFNSTAIAGLEKKGFSINVVYLYNGVFLIGGDGGTTKLVTN